MQYDQGKWPSPEEHPSVMPVSLWQRNRAGWKASYSHLSDCTCLWNRNIHPPLDFSAPTLLRVKSTLMVVLHPQSQYLPVYLAHLNLLPFSDGSSRSYVCLSKARCLWERCLAAVLGPNPTTTTTDTICCLGQ